MLVVDSRAGSKELVPFLQPYGVPVEVDLLPSGDVQFVGSGPDDSIVRVGLELKAIGDLVNSMRSRRLSGFQLDGLCSEYDYAWLVVLGIWREGNQGELIFNYRGQWRPISDGKSSVLYRAVSSYLTTLKLKAGTETGNPLLIERITDYKECAAWVVALYHWFQKPFEQHKAHEAVYSKEYSSRQQGHKAFIRREVGWFERALATMDGIDSNAKFLAERFVSFENLWNASIPAIAETPVEQFLKGGGKKTVKLGKKRAEKIWLSLRSPS